MQSMHPNPSGNLTTSQPTKPWKPLMNFDIELNCG